MFFLLHLRTCKRLFRHAYLCLSKFLSDHDSWSEDSSYPLLTTWWAPPLKTGLLPGLIGLQVSLMTLIRALGLKSEEPPAISACDRLGAAEQVQTAVLWVQHAAGTLSQVGCPPHWRFTVLFVSRNTSVLLLQVLLDLSAVLQQRFWIAPDSRWVFESLLSLNNCRLKIHKLISWNKALDLELLWTCLLWSVTEVAWHIVWCFFTESR